MRSIFSIFLLFWWHFPPAQAEINKSTTILISLDGIGWQFIGNNLTDTPNFDFIARTGVRAKSMITVNPTSTLPNHVTYITGLYPESHGLVSNVFYDPDLDADHYLEPDCSAFDPIFFDQSEPIWSTMEARGIKSAAYFWPTSTSYRLRPSLYVEQICRVNCTAYTPQGLRQFRKMNGRKHCNFDNEVNPFWQRVETAVKWIKSDQPPKLVLLYFDYADLKGHKYGPESIEYLKSIEWLDRHVVGYLIDRLKQSKLLKQTNIIVISDHSMAETNSKRYIDLSKAIEPIMYDIKYPGIWPRSGYSVDDVFGKLKTLNNSHIRFFLKKDIPDWLHWKNNRRIPPIYAQTDIGWLFTKEDKTKHPWKRGSHGWEPTEAMATIFYARGPSFKEGFYDDQSVHGIDVYSLLCHLVGIEPLPNNGSLGNMIRFLKYGNNPIAHEPTNDAILPTNDTAGSIIPSRLDVSTPGFISCADSLHLADFIIAVVLLCLVTILNN